MEAAVPHTHSHAKGNRWAPKLLALTIEHAPCCLLSFAAGILGVHALAHNPVIEFCFAVAGAIIGEYIGHRFFHRQAEAITHTAVPHFRRFDTTKRYSLALAIGLITWGLHQVIFHDHHDDEIGHIEYALHLTLKDAAHEIPFLHTRS